MKSVFSSLLAAVVVLASAPDARARVYRNSNFGYRVVVPDNLQFCDRANSNYEGQEHGSEIILAGKFRCDANKWPSDARYIAFFSAYNGTDDSMTLDLLAKSECNAEPFVPCGPAPAALSIPGHESRAWRKNGPGSRVEINVMTIAGDPHHDGSGKYYIAEVVTSDRDLEQDLALFRKVLSSFRIDP